MTHYKPVYTKKARKELHLLGPFLTDRIMRKVRFYCEQETPLKFAKKLTARNTYRFRVGNYRVIFELDEKGTITILLVLTVKHRKEAYH